MHGASLDADFGVIMLHPTTVHGPDARGRVVDNTTELLPKTDEQHETEVYRLP